MYYDYIIKNGKVLDGAGNPWVRMDIAVKDDFIAEVGLISEHRGKTVIDASKLYVSPGLIDVHTHADFQALVEPTMKNALLQGITTQIVGNCGDSAAPYSAQVPELHWIDPHSRGYDVTWSSVAEYMQALEEAQPYTNLGVLVGHGRLRNTAMGCQNRPPTKVEMDEMKRLLEEGLQAGALGMSTGLGYAPGSFSDTKELIELAHILKRYGGIYVSHTRDQYAIGAFEEIVLIGKEGGLPVHISHFKSVEALQLLEEARDAGVDVTYDLYPYVSGSGYLLGVMPPWLYAGGQHLIVERLKRQDVRDRLKEEMASHRWDGRSIVSLPGDQSIIGTSIEDLAKFAGIHPVDWICDLLIKEGIHVMTVGHFTRENKEQELERLFKHELHMVGSDAIETPKVFGQVHPRTYGAFARVFSQIVKGGVLSLAQAIFKMTYFPARRFGLRDRGLIDEGKSADLLVFDLGKFEDRASLEDPRRSPLGVELVMVNGQVAVQGGQIKGSGSGRILKYQG